MMAVQDLVRPGTIQETRAASTDVARVDGQHRAPGVSRDTLGHRASEHLLAIHAPVCPHHDEVDAAPRCVVNDGDLGLTFHSLQSYIRRSQPLRLRLPGGERRLDRLAAGQLLGNLPCAIDVQEDETRAQPAAQIRGDAQRGPRRLGEIDRTANGLSVLGHHDLRPPLQAHFYLSDSLLEPARRCAIGVTAEEAPLSEVRYRLLADTAPESGR